MARSATLDPLEKFRFSVSFDAGDGADATTLTRLGFHDVQLPKRATNKIAYREGHYADVNQYSAGLTTFEDITLNRGLLPRVSGANLDNALYEWASSVYVPGTNANDLAAKIDGRPTSTAASSYRKDIRIQMLDREGDIVREWKVFNSWPVNFVPGSDLDASEDGDKSIESLTLAYEDFQEITDSTTPVAVSSSVPTS